MLGENGMTLMIVFGLATLGIIYGGWKSIRPKPKQDSTVYINSEYIERPFTRKIRRVSVSSSPVKDLNALTKAIAQEITSEKSCVDAFIIDVSNSKWIAPWTLIQMFGACWNSPTAIVANQNAVNIINVMLAIRDVEPKAKPLRKMFYDNLEKAIESFAYTS